MMAFAAEEGGRWKQDADQGCGAGDPARDQGPTFAQASNVCGSKT